MRARDLFELILLAAIWGASFLFMRYAAPRFGPLALVEVRVAVATLFLLPLLAAGPGLGAWRARAPAIALVGILNSALPFVLLTFATLSLTAGFAAILNATTPLWTALIGRLWLREPVRRVQWGGMALGLLGVVVLVWGRVDFKPGASGWAVVAALAATASYGVAANYTRRATAGTPALALACGSQLSAALALAPFAAATWPAVPPPAASWAAALALGVVCSGVAYILYFRLIAHVGAMKAASVTFLVPVFAASWGALFLGEAPGTQMIAGGALILAGTALALGMVAPAAR